MALPAHSNAESFISSKEEDTGLQTVTAFLSEMQKNEEVFEVWINLWNSQEPSDRTIFEASLLKEQLPWSPYHQNTMDWGKNEEDPSGSSFTNLSLPQIDIDADDVDEESYDRVILLAKKYASEKVNLSKEDNARLEMINQKMDLRYPRYSTKDWELLDEAKTLINELSDMSGEKAE